MKKPFSSAVNILSCAGVLLVISNVPARAGIINGSFETRDFTGYSSIGNASIKAQGDAFDGNNPGLNDRPTTYFAPAPSAGTYQAFLSNDTTAVDQTGQSSREIEDFLGLQRGMLNAEASKGSATPRVVFNGSALKQSVSVNAGDKLAFHYNYFDGDYGEFTDFSFFTINDSLIRLTDANTPDDTAANPSYGLRGDVTRFFTFQSAGAYNVGFGTVNVGDGALDSGIFIDNISIENAGVAPVPELSTGLLLMVGMAALGALRCAVTRCPCPAKINDRLA